MMNSIAQWNVPIAIGNKPPPSRCEIPVDLKKILTLEIAHQFEPSQTYSNYTSYKLQKND